jgi:hypothetical protein
MKYGRLDHALALALLTHWPSETVAYRLGQIGIKVNIHTLEPAKAFARPGPGNGLSPQALSGSRFRTSSGCFSITKGPLPCGTR